MRIKFYRSPDADEGLSGLPDSTEGVVSQAEVIQPEQRSEEFIPLTADDYKDLKDESQSPDPASTEEKPEIKAEEKPAKTEGKKGKSSKSKVEGKADVEIDVKTDDPAPSEETASEEEFKIPDEIEIQDKDIVTIEDESSWQTVAKALDLGDIDKDDFDVFKGKLTEVISTKERDAEVRGYEKAKGEYSTDLSKFAPEAQIAIDFLNKGGSIEELLNTGKEYDGVLALDDEALVRARYEEEGWEEDKIDQKLSSLITDDKLSIEAYETRKLVERNKAVAINEAIEKRNQAHLKSQNDQKAFKDKEDAVIRESISRFDDFMGTKVPQKVKDWINKNWDEGKYRKLMASDPKFVAQAIIFHELGEQAVKSLSKTQYEKASEGMQEKLANTSKTPSQGSSGHNGTTVETPQTGDNDPFSEWNVLYNTLR